MRIFNKKLFDKKSKKNIDIVKKVLKVNNQQYLKKT